MSDAATADPLEYGELVVAALAARRFYIDQHTHTRIAADLRLSRFKVARLIDAARQAGIVEIRINAPGGVNGELSGRVRERLGLRNAVVVNVPDAGDDATVRQRLGAIAAGFLEDLLTPADVLGLGWSRSVLTAAEHLRHLPPCRVVQLTGALTHSDVVVNLVDTVDRLARLGGGTGHSFYAPLFVPDPAAARAVVRQPEVSRAFEQFGAVTVAVVGIGSWAPADSTLHDALYERERTTFFSRHVVADLSGVFIDAAGNGLDVPHRRQVVGVNAEQLRAVPNVVGIAYGPGKAAAVHAACTTGYVDTLVTTAPLAHALLDRA